MLDTLCSNVDTDMDSANLTSSDTKHIAEGRSTRCRFCNSVLSHSMVDLGLSPFCEDFISKDELKNAEIFRPLEAMVCEHCWLVQVRDVYSNSEIFNEDYGYFSSYSSSWLRHARRYVEMATQRFNLDINSFVVEVASNDGYLLRNFVERGIPCLGIDPAKNVAAAAEAVGVDTRVEFFTRALATSLSDTGQQADLIIGNNVLAHTPYVNDFIGAVSCLLKPSGCATFEFPHLLELIEHCQFDTIYHEHYSYYSLYTVCRLFESVGMQVVDVEKLETAGGSLRIFVEHQALNNAPSAAVASILEEELAAQLRNIATYQDFGDRAANLKNDLLSLLINLKKNGKKVIGYGAPGKGNTLLNYCGIKTDLLPATCDRSLHKHGRYCPGSRIPIYPPEFIDTEKPDYVLILPWNLEREITEQLAHIRRWGGKFIIPVPSPRIVD